MNGLKKCDTHTHTHTQHYPLDMHINEENETHTTTPREILSHDKKGNPTICDMNRPLGHFA